MVQVKKKKMKETFKTKFFTIDFRNRVLVVNKKCTAIELYTTLCDFMDSNHVFAYSYPFLMITHGHAIIDDDWKIKNQHLVTFKQEKIKGFTY